MFIKREGGVIIMEIPGVTVMEVQEGSNKVLILFILILVICLIVGGILGAVMDMVVEGVVVGASAGLVIFVCILLLNMCTNNVMDKTYYTVKISNDVNMEEFLEHYTIVRQDGDIYTVVETN